MSAYDLATVLPPNVLRALTLAAMLQKAGPGELRTETEAQGVEFIQLLSSALVHLASHSLALIGEVKDEHEESDAQADSKTW